MDLMVNPVITDFQQDVNGDIKMLKIGQKKEDAYANIIGQAEGGDLDNNKTATINVSTYTEPVEILPTEGKDGMKKATVTLSNIPSASGAGVYAWKDGDNNIVFFSFEVAPETATTESYMNIAYSEEEHKTIGYPNSCADYLKVSDTKISITYKGETTEFTRDSSKDNTFWGSWA